jgi:hypothetical protein
MIDLALDFTAKRRGSKTGTWSSYDYRVEHFADMADAKAFLTDLFGKCKTQPIYQDTKTKGTIKTGRIYCYIEDDMTVQVWVSFYDGKYKLPIHPVTGKPYYTTAEAKALREEN